MNVKNLINYSKKIEKNNASFRALSKTEKRVAIAKDAAAQLLIGKYEGSPGTYVNVEASGSFDEALKKTACRVCAIGSVLVSSFRLGAVKDSRVFVTDYGWGEFSGSYGEGDDKALGLAFTEKMLRAMEDDFECNTTNEISLIQDPDARLFTILENVIKNDGKYVQPKELDDFDTMIRRADDSEDRFNDKKAKATALRAA